jgi:hypothetical protein
VIIIVQQCPGMLEALTQDQLDIVGWHLSYTHNEVLISGKCFLEHARRIIPLRWDGSL